MPTKKREREISQINNWTLNLKEEKKKEKKTKPKVSKWEVITQIREEINKIENT